MRSGPAPIDDNSRFRPSTDTLNESGSWGLATRRSRTRSGVDRQAVALLVGLEGVIETEQAGPVRIGGNVEKTHCGDLGAQQGRHQLGPLQEACPDG